MCLHPGDLVTGHIEIGRDEGRRTAFVCTMSIPSDPSGAKDLLCGRGRM